LSEVLDRLTELERKVANVKDWKEKYEAEKQKHEEDKQQWDKDKHELIGVRAFRDELRAFLDIDGAATPTQLSTRTTVNLTDKELAVNLTHEEKEVNMTTTTVAGRVLFCALTDLSKDGFGELALSEALRERGWNVPHNTLAPNLAGLVKDGTLIRLGTRGPAKYRLPQKVKMNVRQEGL